ncbi:MAG: hypothetical protein LBB48_04880 [Treponema sp.]|jgi:hypothetical protein|nr:hypothetical protein [Treponema sp.]
MRKNLLESRNAPSHAQAAARRAGAVIPVSGFRLRAVRWRVFLVFLIAPPLPAQETAWYISNAAGLALSPAPSRIVALRNDYCLGMAIISWTLLPPDVVVYYKSSYIVDSRTLYEKGKPKRQQWVFRDDKGMSRLTAVADVKDGKSTLVCIEQYNESHFLMEERQFSEEERSATVFFYEKSLLVRSETRVETFFTIEPEPAVDDGEDDADGGDGSGQHTDARTESGETAGTGTEDAEGEAAAAAPAEPQKEWRETSFWTDYYYYSRSYSIRGVKRIIHAGAQQALTISFPQLKPRPEFDRNFVRPGAAHNSNFLNEPLSGDSVSEVTYTIDDKGRTLAESRYDEAGTLISEVKNNWTRDRLASVEWRSFNGEGDVLERRLTEYEYDSKDDRVMERNYVNGVLERTVRTEGRQEIEEVHMDGKVVLRIVWEDGQKIKEERVRGRQ